MTTKKMSLTPVLLALTSPESSFTTSDLKSSLEILFTTTVSDVQAAAFLTALRLRAFDQDPAMIAAAVETMRRFALELDVDGAYVDVVGTGGDGKNTFNVSTTAGLVAAGMGIRVCKHGNRAATSSSGAADVLISLGAQISNVTPSTVSTVLGTSPFAFLFAPVFHPLMAKVAPVRKLLGFPTLFNVLGPLLNPAPLSARVVGVNSRALGPIFARSIILLDRDETTKSNSMVVWGEEGLDEISPAGPTMTWSVAPGSDVVVERVIAPEDFGLRRHSLDTVASGTPHENAQLLQRLVRGELADNHPVLDYVLINASALAVVAGVARDYKHGVELAKQSIMNGKAKAALEAFIQATQSYDKE
ncbi:glycosyl transferase family, a/b domain-containing protein [Lipomyces arxii]|uniref:glycosyl transferase family, a/b domain-containing protein n=1 Tax=Lipomyces arxii TaxID=56418 RepID=UPI0034CE7558